jgi:hypothetical protein
MKSAYIFTYDNQDIFYQQDILSLFKEQTKSVNLLLEQKDNDLFLVQEYPSNEFYKCNYNSDIELYFNEYNYVIVSNHILNENQLKKIRTSKPLILFFY